MLTRCGQDPGYPEVVGYLGCRCFIWHDLAGEASGCFTVGQTKEKLPLFTFYRFHALPHKDFHLSR